MCEHCGCLAIDAIALLTAEHDQALDYVRSLEQAADALDTGVAQTLGGQLRTLLRTHTIVEEQGLFPALAGEFSTQMVELAAEHQQIEAALDRLWSVPLARDWATQVGAAMRLLRDHIRKEQDGVFPAALSSLRPADWQRLDHLRVAAGTPPADDEPEGPGAVRHVRSPS